MSRSLRPRRSRPSYAALFQYEDEQGEGSSAPKMVIDEEGDSGSDFSPEGGDAEDAEGETDPDPDDGLLSASDDIPSEGSDDSATPSSKKKSKSGKSTSSSGPYIIRERPQAKHAPGLSRPSTSRNMYALPNPTVHLRHRPATLHHRPHPVERLTEIPTPFSSPKTVLTSSGTAAGTTVAERVSKAWGYNVGPGPLWELLEDRSWYKEAHQSSADDAKRRPMVYQDLKVKEGLRILNPDEARAYTPHSGEDANQPPSPVSCSFGPIQSQTRVEIGIFDMFKVSNVFPESMSHIFNPGAPVWGLDWCPVHSDHRAAINHKHYLAVGPFPHKELSPTIGKKSSSPTPACIQIWSFGPSSSSEQADDGEMRCEMIVCIDIGPAFVLKWCPLPAHDPLDEDDREDTSSPRKLGVLAGTFADGSLAFFVIPHPEDIQSSGYNSPGPVYVRLVPILRIEHEETSCWALDWANSQRIAVGCTNGFIAVYDIAEALRSGSSEELLPSTYLSVHQSAIRAICWLRAPPSASRLNEDPTIVASGGYDGVECLTDIRDPYGNVMNRTRDVINCMAFSPYSGGPVTIDHENIVKVYSASPLTLGRGHGLMEPNGPVWDVSLSELHPQLAVGAADGSCSTTNMLRSTRRSGLVPFLVHKIYQLDYSRTSGEFRMLEHFLPQEPQDRPAAIRAKKADDSVVITPVGTGAWPAEVAVQRVAWNSCNGFCGAPLLASATGSGLCRIDWLMGKWTNTRIPYGGVEGIRMEVEVEGAEEDDEND
ncbi:hypothetical protein PUNSTDRAFT_104680 [Punctularia strigosozonata HHB-11173 SS5]|uniref:uncharacterized protein n=1 Tax=Punctularia strigosozonata (strain HHB-11173) TaxID=741275 RepID=UPI0004416849|nr:uncharacterized protein PUNSTDRAFT_104680 [Punctularia strigosozonata HHB-11173 SS5]EIN07154.1 hypothetical protein PUNSTDRAFT_104680 [Punctularia strigosozonata HHB-11173 SS5]